MNGSLLLASSFLLTLLLTSCATNPPSETTTIQNEIDPSKPIKIEVGDDDLMKAPRYVPHDAASPPNKGGYRW